MLLQWLFKNMQSDNTCSLVAIYASLMRFMLEVAGISGQLGCNDAHLLELAEAAVIRNYPLLSGVSTPTGMVLLCFKNMRTVYHIVLYLI